MNVETFENEELLASVRDKINTNFSKIGDVINNICDDEQLDNPIRNCLKNDFANPCDDQNISNVFLEFISTELGSAFSVDCPDSSPLPSCSVYQPVTDGINSLIQNIVQNIGSATEDCEVPSCPVYMPMYSAKIKIAENVMETVLSTVGSAMQDPCQFLNSLSSSNLEVSGPLSSCIPGISSGQVGVGVKSIIESFFETALNTVGTAMQNPCQFLNLSGSSSLSIAGELSACINPVPGGVVGEGVKRILTDLVETAFSTIGVAMQNPTSFICSGGTLVLSGPLASCLPSISGGASIKIGVKNIIESITETITETITDVLSSEPEDLMCNSNQMIPLSGPLASCINRQIRASGFRKIISKTVQTTIDTVTEVLRNPCQAATLVGPLQDCLDVTLPDFSSLFQEVLSSECALDEIVVFISNNQKDILPAALALPMAEEAKESILAFVDSYKCELFEKFIDTTGQAADTCVEESIKLFASEFALEFITENTCEILTKINEGSSQFLYSNQCQGELNTFVDSLLCGYLDHLIETPLVNIVGDGNGNFSGGTSPMYCVLNSTSKIIEEYAPLFWVVINGEARQMKIPTQMKINLQDGTVVPQFYNGDGEKI
jgi:uncharacterized protein (DUF2164 family)